MVRWPRRRPSIWSAAEKSQYSARLHYSEFDSSGNSISASCRKPQVICALCLPAHPLASPVSASTTLLTPPGTPCSTLSLLRFRVPVSFPTDSSSVFTCPCLILRLSARCHGYLSASSAVIFQLSSNPYPFRVARTCRNSDGDCLVIMNTFCDWENCCGNFGESSDGRVGGWPFQWDIGLVLGWRIANVILWCEQR